MISLTLKSFSATRWSCSWIAVQAIYEQIYNVIKALFVLTKVKTQTKTEMIDIAECSL